MKPKTLGKEPKGIVNKDLGYISQIFLSKTLGNNTVPCGFVYVIAPLVRISEIQNVHYKLMCVKNALGSPCPHC